jgi:hypothetical protein
MDSALVDAEPGILTAPGGQKFVFKDGITAKVNETVQATPADIDQNAGDTWDDAVIEITGTPYGEWENLPTLYPYASHRFNQNIYGADAAWTIHTTSGRLLTFTRAAVTGLATLNIAPDKTLFGSGFKVTAIRKNNSTWATANSLYQETAVAFTDWSTFDPTQALKVDAAAAWGALAAPWNGIETMDGWEISFGLNINFIKTSAVGSFQALFKGLTVMAKCNPANVTRPDIIAAHPIQGGTARRGKRIASGNNLVLTGAGGSPVITLTSAQIRQPGYEWGTDKIQIGELGFEAQRIFTSGQPQPLYTLA